MQAVRVITGRVMPLDRSDVDTDQIIPAVWLKRVERTGFGAGLFSRWAETDPSFPLNKPEYSGASVLVAGPNFGIGSSREHAVWALVDRGFQAVISPRFGDIFRNNATKSGLLPVVVEPAIADVLLRAATGDPTLEVTIDVERRMLRAPAAGISVSFPLDDFTRYRLLEGLDDVDLTLRHEASITRYETDRPVWMPRVEPVSTR